MLSMSMVCAAGVATGTGVHAAAAAKTPSCAPGSFDDTDNVVSTINATINKAVSPIQMAAKKDHIAPGGSVTKVKTIAGGLQQTTISRSSDGATYDFEIDVAQASDTPTWTKVSYGSLTDDGVVSGVHTYDTSLTVDYDALRSVISSSKTTGDFSATIELVKDPTQAGNGTKTTTGVTFSDITVKPNDTHGARSGTYTHVLEGGVGGSYDFSGTIPTPCPGGVAGPAVTISVQRQHLDNGNKERSFRRDAAAAGYTLDAGQQAIAFECGTHTVTGTPTDYLLKKIENADGSSASYHLKYKNETTAQCDSRFGALVSPTDSSSDWSFPHPLTFPGEW